jgi:hypothetical protein
VREEGVVKKEGRKESKAGRKRKESEGGRRKGKEERK